MNKMRKVLSSILAFLMVLSFVQMPAKVSAAEVSAEAKALAGQLIKYYETHQESAQTDIERVLDEMEAIDPGYAEVWDGIMDYWTVVNTPGFANEDKVPEGLPTDDSLCIVILGYALNSDGTMKPELIGRLQAGLNVANQYPNAYVCVTGGGTASGNKDVTEGGLMGDWLLENGLDEARLIRETRASDTVGNARYTYDILATTYPTVDKVVIVTSDYHIPRGSILYQSKFLTEAYLTDGRKINVIDNSGNETGSNGYENLSLQVSGVASITGVSKASSVDPLSVLESFEARLVSPLSRSTELKVEVEATYNNGYKRDVTPYATISEIDPELGTNQVINVSYEENGIALATSFNLSQGSAVATNYRANLAPVVEEASKVVVASLTVETREIFEDAYVTAIAMLENKYASEEQVKEALDALSTILNNLKTRENVALNKTVTASHNQAVAALITNGSINDYYESKEGSNIPAQNVSLVIDLYNTYALDTVNVVPYFQGEPRYYHYDVAVSTDNETWDVIAQYRGTEFNTKAGQAFVLDTAKTARYIKIQGVYTYVEGRNDIDNLHITEIFAYGEMVEANPVPYEAPKMMSIKSENVSLGRPVTVDSNNGKDPSVLTDGKAENVYTGSTNGVANAWAIVELEEVTPISSVNVITYCKNTSIQYHYEVLVSEDQDTWVSVGKHLGANPGYAGTTIRFNEINAKYVKVKGIATTNSNGEFHLVEISVFTNEENIAYGKEVTTSVAGNSRNTHVTNEVVSNSDYWDCQSLPTGSGAEAWGTLPEAQRPFVIIDLDGLYAVDYVQVNNYVQSNRYYQYEIYTSRNGKEWTLFGEKKNTTDSQSPYEIINTPTNARFVKLVATYHNRNSGFHVVEIRVGGVKQEETLADYAAVEAAIATVPTSLEGYSISSVTAVKTAINNVDYNVVDDFQATVDAYAVAINEAVAALEAAPADYSAVNESIAIAKAEKPYIIDYTDVQTALNAVVFGKDATEQAVVNEYAVAINRAIANAEYTPKPIQNLVAEAVDYKTIKLTWDAEAVSTTYVVERQNTKTGLWITVATTTEPTYTVAGVKTGKEYTYRVKGLRVFEEVTYEGEYSAEAKGTATLVGAPELSVTQSGDAIFNLTWTQVAGATRYIVYRQANGGEWKKILTLGGDVTTYTSANLKPGNYAYQVKAARYDGVERIMTEGSNTVEVEATVSAPTLDKVSYSPTSVTLKWNAVEGMKYYEVYATTNGVTRRVKVTTATTYKASNLKAQLYTFKVRGYAKVNDQTIYTSYSNEYSMDFGNVSFE